MLKITQKVEKKKAFFTLEGRLDTLTSRDLDKALMPVLDSVDEVIIDCKEMEYISSAGLRVILKALQSKTEKDWFKLINVNERVMEILDMTGLIDELVIE